MMKLLLLHRILGETFWFQYEQEGENCNQDGSQDWKSKEIRHYKLINYRKLYSDHTSANLQKIWSDVVQPKIERTIQYLISLFIIF